MYWNMPGAFVLRCSEVFSWHMLSCSPKRNVHHNGFICHAIRPYVFPHDSPYEDFAYICVFRRVKWIEKFSSYAHFRNLALIFHTKVLGLRYYVWIGTANIYCLFFLKKRELLMPRVPLEQTNWQSDRGVLDILLLKKKKFSRRFEHILLKQGQLIHFKHKRLSVYPNLIRKNKNVF